MNTKTHVRNLALPDLGRHVLWNHFSQPVRRLEAVLSDEVVPRRYGEVGSNPASYTSDAGGGNCFTSDITYAYSPRDKRFPRPDGDFTANHWSWHLPMLDIDDPLANDVELDDFLKRLFQADIHWVESTNNWHVYVEARPYATSTRAMPWETFSHILGYLSAHDIVDRWWVRHTVRDERAVVRKPDNRKQTLTNPCMWCGQVFADADSRDDHEEECDG